MEGLCRDICRQRACRGDHRVPRSVHQSTWHSGGAVRWFGPLRCRRHHVCAAWLHADCPRRRKGWGYAGGLVDTGLYGVVRHPLYLGVMVLYVGAILAGQSWPVAAVAVPGIAVMYWSMLLEERWNRQRFGDDYGHYMKMVPRMNIILGVIRLLRRRNRV